MRTVLLPLIGTLFFSLLQGCAVNRQQQERVISLENRLNDIQRTLDRLPQKMEAMQNDTMVLQDQMETTRLQVQKMQLFDSKPKAQQAAIIRAYNKQSLPPLIEIHSIPASNVATASSTTAATKDSSDENPLTSYRAAYALYEAGKYNEAIEKFTDFVKKNPQHDYADNAIYWTGEAYYDQKEFMLAISEFRQVLKEYPTSNKLADAVLKIGLSFERLDDLGEAKKAYAMVTEQYPYSEAAKRAHDRLAKLQ
jgi:tol-pal system protein YbgF